MQLVQPLVGAGEGRPPPQVAADGHHLGPEHGCGGLDLRVPEPVEGERRLERHGIAARERVLVGRERRSECFRVERPIRLEDLRMPDAHPITRGAADLESRESRQVLPGIEEHPAAAPALGGDVAHLDRPDRRRRPGLKDREVQGHDLRCLPAGVVMAGELPARLRLTQVDLHAVIDVRGSDLRRRGSPRLVRADLDPSPVGQVDLQLGKQPDLGAVPAPVLARHPPQAAAVPPVAQDRSDRVATRAEERGHVEGVDQQSFAVRRPAGSESAVPDRLTVHGQGVDPE